MTEENKEVIVVDVVVVGKNITKVEKFHLEGMRMIERMEHTRIERLVVKKEDAIQAYVEVASAEEIVECIWWR